MEAHQEKGRRWYGRPVLDRDRPGERPVDFERYHVGRHRHRAWQVHARGSAAGTYTLVETQAPFGYNLNTTVYEFTVSNEDGSVTWTEGKSPTIDGNNVYISDALTTTSVKIPVTNLFAIRTGRRAIKTNMCRSSSASRLRGQIRIAHLSLIRRLFPSLPQRAPPRSTTSWHPLAVSRSPKSTSPRSTIRTRLAPRPTPTR